MLLGYSCVEMDADASWYDSVLAADAIGCDVVMKLNTKRTIGPIYTSDANNHCA